MAIFGARLRKQDFLTYANVLVT